MSQPRLTLTNLTKRYPGVVAVDHVSLTIGAGEVHGLVGENGAGKSTLIKLLAGAVTPDEGEIRLDGQILPPGNVQAAYQRGLAFIHQELSLIPYFAAAENIYLGHPYPRTPWGGINRRQLRAQAQQLLAELGVQLPVDRPVRRLSPGQQTMIAVARAFAWIGARQRTHQTSPALIVMDEPTAALTTQEIDQLFAAIRRLRAAGATVIYVSHRLDEIFTITDQVTVMRNGQIVHSGPTAALDQATLVQLMTGQAERLTAPAIPRQPAMAAPLLEVEHVTGPGITDLTFRLYAGEILGVAGLVGAGRSELLHLLYGAACPTAGTIRWQGEIQRNTSPASAIRQGIAQLPEERRSQGLLLTRPIFENITLAHLRHFARGGLLLNRRRELVAAQTQQQALALKASNLRQPVAQLSGGNQQKVLFARSLVGRAAGIPLRLLLLDEPTRGVDVGAKAEIHAIIRAQAAAGVAVILVSSELPELLAVSQRVLVLREGRQIALVQTAAVDQPQLLRYCYGIV